MSRSRREFLVQTAAAAAAAGLAPAARAEPPRSRRAPGPLRVLFLGGTGFLGPPTVRELLARGHEVTLFNRGRTNVDLFPELEKLHGDRTKDVSALAGDRRWDAIIDTSAYFPRVVDLIAEQLAARVERYVLISTMSVYPDFLAENAEDSPLVELADPSVEQVTGETYGGLKALCEAAAERSWPGRTLNIRPGLIVGPGDPTDRLTWWPVRVHRGGEALAPGDPELPIRFIDARDLARWTVYCLEQGSHGVYNAIGPAGGLTMAEFLYGCKVVLGADCRFTWVDNDFLAEQKVNSWMGEDSLPIWIPAAKPYVASTWDKARAAGLAHRPTGDTIRDTLAWALAERGTERAWRSGITPEREAELLAAWHQRGS